MRDDTKDFITKLANEVRSVYKIETPIKDIEAVVSRLGGVLCVEQNTNLLDLDFDGLTRKTNEGFEIRIPKCYYDRLEQRNFIIAHELGHLFLHMGYQIDSELWNRQSDTEYSRFMSDANYQADYFAYNLLMPKNDFLTSIDELSDGEYINPELVANKYNVSVATVNVYGRILGVFKMPWEY